MPENQEPDMRGSSKRRLRRRHSTREVWGAWRSGILRKPLRVAALAVLGLGLVASLTLAIERYSTARIGKFGGEHRLVFQLEAPYGSVNLRAGTNPSDVAVIETLSEDADAHNCQWSYGVRNTIGILRIGIGTDEGMRATPPIAMWHANSGLSLASSTAPQSDMGFPMRSSPFSFPMPRMYGGFQYAWHPALRTVSTDAGTKVEAISTPGTQIYITKDLPLVFSANLGFGQSTLDLSGLPLTSASIETGASQADIYCMQPNTETLDYCSVRAGLGQCTFLGISNLNANHFTFHGAVGSYHLGFEGRLQHNLDAVIELGMGKCSLSIPPTAGRVQVFYDSGLLSSFSFSGLARVRNGYARSPGFDLSNSPILTLHLSSGVGSISVSYH